MRCPRCLFEGAPPSALPKPNDVAICGACGAVVIFDLELLPNVLEAQGLVALGAENLAHLLMLHRRARTELIRELPQFARIKELHQ